MCKETQIGIHKYYGIHVHKYYGIHILWNHSYSGGPIFLGLFKMNWFEWTRRSMVSLMSSNYSVCSNMCLNIWVITWVFLPHKTVIFSSLFPPFRWSFFSWRLSSWVAFCSQRAFVLVCYIPHNPHCSLYQHWCSDKAGSPDCDPPVVLIM